MHFFSKHIAALTTALLLFGVTYANPLNLWDLAQPMPSSGGLRAPESGGNVFSFTTGAANTCIGLTYEFYSSADCSPGTLLIHGTYTYSNHLIDAARANKTFYIDGSSLYALAQLLAATNALCAKEVDANNTSNSVAAPISCHSGTGQCISTSTHGLSGLSSMGCA